MYKGSIGKEERPTGRNKVESSSPRPAQVHEPITSMADKPTSLASESQSRTLVTLRTSARNLLYSKGRLDLIKN
jgi:hypothetical protein